MFFAHLIAFRCIVYSIKHNFSRGSVKVIYCLAKCNYCQFLVNGQRLPTTKQKSLTKKATKRYRSMQEHRHLSQCQLKILVFLLLSVEFRSLGLFICSSSSTALVSAVRPSVRLSACPPVHLSACPSVRLSVCLLRGFNSFN